MFSKVMALVLVALMLGVLTHGVITHSTPPTDAAAADTQAEDTRQGDTQQAIAEAYNEGRLQGQRDMVPQVEEAEYQADMARKAYTQPEWAIDGKLPCYTDCWYDQATDSTMWAGAVPLLDDYAWLAQQLPSTRTLMLASMCPPYETQPHGTNGMTCFLEGEHTNAEGEGLRVNCQHAMIWCDDEGA